ncbi:TPA: lipase, partial [Campylobacter coli]|nr:lipase [Campylobacter coli]
MFKVLTHNIFQKECVTIGKFEPLMAFYFIKRFDLLAHINEDYLDSRGGFRASLFQNKENKEFILAIAGSDLRPLKFDIGDLISDFILLNGKIPKKQF